MKRLFLLSTLLFSFCFSAIGQENERFKNKNKKGEETTEEASEAGNVDEERPSIRRRLGISDRLVFGGNLSLSFGNNSLIYIAPAIGYQITEKLIAGGGYIYQYAKFSRAFNPNTNQFEPFNYESTIHGPKFFAYYNPVEIIYVGSQLEYLNHDVLNFPSQETTRQWTPVLFLEIGYFQKIGSGGVMIGMRYNVLHDVDSPYNSALIPTVGLFF